MDHKTEALAAATTVADRYRAAQEARIRAIKVARDAGATWDEVGRATGLVRSAAQQLLARHDRAA